ncbi:lipoate--protein ligase family protein [Brevibacterium sp. 50QC2O2]|uniref:lipoate--protein ligase family protein n=1 Tax=Brevibacterium TaxID=1696 RepID=UPI00211CB090|nr:MULTISPECIES: biotin/lipoate A/B protein ligase family protein [unclassified Brevibacterium]MCQ9367836.1 lipoate--protein ligase family protein [Brevibacterium sp. 91QC2O2]MCQ9386911.1 lipoate--protein ligase family protein [Brevibacterium sp. 68QC2CO]MCQ9388095.1 lipoate--protein ligase family protein [Brevibacterium sp. 50QC2O2]
MSSENRDFHSERKVPGGKLIVLDGTLTDGVLSALQLSGDFFIEPEEGYFAIAPALLGVATTDDRAQIIERIDRALAGAAREAGMSAPALHGFSAADVAWALKRGMAGATEFYDHDWDFIHDVVRPTRHNVALDQVLLEEVAAGRRNPTVRFWEWEDTATVIGAFQSYVNEVDQAGVDKYGVEVVRRISGGGAMFMEGGNCVTFSMYAPGSLVAGLDYEESYKYLDTWVLQGLRDLGVNAFYVPINDISSDHGKIGGAAQRRLTDGPLLHHDTMSYDIDADKMSEVLRVGKAKLSDKGIRSAKKRVDPLRRQTGVPRQEVIAAMQRAFIGLTNARIGEVTQAELDRALELVETKFGTEAWTHRVP